MADPGKESPEPTRYHVERLDDVRERLARLEGIVPSLATKEDVANSKVALIMMWLGAIVVVASAAIGAVVRFWPGGAA